MNASKNMEEKETVLPRKCARRKGSDRKVSARVKKN